MIGIDTNVLLRLLLNDSPAQNKRIDNLLAEYGQSEASVHIADVVLAETLWVLRTAYRQPKAALQEALSALLAEPAFHFENRSAVTQALEEFGQAQAGFSDCLIAARNLQSGCEFTATFDKQMHSLGGIRLI